jgi:hypothetical protein
MCPRCRRDFTPDLKRKAQTEKIANAIIVVVLLFALAVVLFIALLPGIVINSLRGRYKNRTRGLISTAVRDWQTWLISMPFAIPLFIFVVGSFNDAMARQAAKEEQRQRYITQSQTETRVLAQVPLNIDRGSSSNPAGMELTDVSIKFDYPPKEFPYGPGPSDPPRVATFRDLPPFGPEPSNQHMINFDGHYDARFNTVAQRDKMLADLSKAVKAWELEFPDAVKKHVTDVNSTPTPNNTTADAPRAVVVEESTQPVSSPQTSPLEAIPVERTFSVVGIVDGDTLNVRSGPSATNNIVAKLPRGYPHIRILGASVMNDTTEWVNVSFGNRSGWVTKQFLKAE